ncbi:MAG: hypothetical protein A3B11_00230 [Candidatus Taylorbacteria bacterium RIFCSPLOWO2_01_FULL_44_26]|uniref:Plasmid stabilization protein n=2 Tax=Candidatus Tayloriibacteriota TaxID=1817919 RepID=A0A1G2MMY6_9BACT|nr:MAG: hypothetical protein A3D50_01870 [Candidatus Taylorbacteria bacterium RIFCSPHIGHO2_02_FULL_44_12]OHA31115.1 MAG: hypothetical protein A3B11_00230 [Candidatus Taylorbacteria bacterium RIFCSPLOWO2_01_FULL_44_26]
MRVDYHSNFKKQFKKLPKSIQDKFYLRLKVFLDNPFASELNNHALKGRYRECRSINVTGDMRTVYSMKEGKDIIVFLLIGSHSELYG